MTKNENMLLSWEPEGLESCSEPSDNSSTVLSEASDDRDFITSDTDGSSYVSRDASGYSYPFIDSSSQEFIIHVSARRQNIHHTANLKNRMGKFQ